MMKFCVLMGSPRKDGNTSKLVHPFVEELTSRGHMCRLVDLHNLKLEPCIACRQCQDIHDRFGCVHEDDMQDVFDTIMDSDLIVLASPIYSWYATPALKTVMDRLVYGMNKYYGKERGPSLWQGKAIALITTCGYPVEKGADLWEEGMKRYCKHSRLRYLGMLGERDMGYDTIFMDEDKDHRSREFADRVAGELD